MEGLAVLTQSATVQIDMNSSGGMWVVPERGGRDCFSELAVLYPSRLARFIKLTILSIPRRFGLLLCVNNESAPCDGRHVYLSLVSLDLKYFRMF